VGAPPSRPPPPNCQHMRTTRPHSIPPAGPPAGPPQPLNWRIRQGAGIGLMNGQQDVPQKAGARFGRQARPYLESLLIRRWRNAHRRLSIAKPNNVHRTPDLGGIIPRGSGSIANRVSMGNFHDRRCHVWRAGSTGRRRMPAKSPPHAGRDAWTAPPPSAAAAGRPTGDARLATAPVGCRRATPWRGRCFPRRREGSAHNGSIPGGGTTCPTAWARRVPPPPPTHHRRRPPPPAKGRRRGYRVEATRRSVGVGGEGWPPTKPADSGGDSSVRRPSRLQPAPPPRRGHARGRAGGGGDGGQGRHRETGTAQ